jgi:hypothetical protein
MNKDYLPKTPEARLWHLAEECGEVTRAVSKIGRFGRIGIGYDGHQDNTAALLSELDDLEHAIAAVRKDIEATCQQGEPCDDPKACLDPDGCGQGRAHMAAVRADLK